MTTFETAKVDDRVFDIKHGWGLISKVFPKNMRPITVQFSKYDRSYMFNGKYLETDINQVLFWDEVKIVPQKSHYLSQKQILKYQFGTVKKKVKLHRHFSHFEKNGKIVTFAEGRTSWSQGDKSVVDWEYWELPKD